MADENTQEVEQVEEPQGEPKAKTDWKAEARKWENLAKKGKAAEEELARLKEAQMTEQEKANARAEKAEQELAELKAESERLQLAREFSQEHGIPLEMMELLPAENMEKFCQVYKANQIPVHSVATVGGSRVVREGGGSPSTREIFASFADKQLNR